MSSPETIRRAPRLAAPLLALPLLALPLLALPLLALTQVPGPIRIGPSWGEVDAANRSASLFTTIVNHGVLADRLVSGACPGWGDVTLVGLDPATEGDRPQDHGVLIGPGGTATLSAGGPHLTLTDASRPLTDGTLVPCSLDFVHSGQRLVVFSIGPHGGVTDEP